MNSSMTTNGDITYMIYRHYGSRCVLVVTDHADLFYYRKEWKMDFGKPLTEQEELFTDLPAKYSGSATLNNLYKNTFMPGPVAGPGAYSKQIAGLQVKVQHPAADYKDTLESVIISLNDGHYWSRERIADWLETLDVNPILNNPKEETNV